MAAKIDVKFNSLASERYNNTVVGGPAATATDLHLNRQEYFSGDASGEFDGISSTLSFVDDAGYDFGDTKTAYYSVDFFFYENGRFGLISQRVDEDNHWYIILDTIQQKLKFVAITSSSTIFSTDFDYSAIITLNKVTWHKLQINVVNDIVRFYLNGKFITKITGSTTEIEIAAPLFLGVADESATSTPDLKYFKGLIDNFIVNDTNLYSSSDIDRYVDRWSGDVIRLVEFSPSISIESILNNPQAIPQNIPDFARANNRLYIAGIDPMQRVNESSIGDVGLDNPTAPVISGTTGGSYQYVLTIIDSLGNESGPSPLSNQYSVSSSQTATITKPSGTYTTWRVYRRNVTAAQQNFFLVQELAFATGSWIDNDSAVPDTTTIAPDLTVIPPPLANFIKYLNGRMYYGCCKVDTDYFPTRVYYSQINELEQVKSDGWFYVGDDDSEAITGMVIFFNALYIFKERSLYVAIGDPESLEFQIRKLDHGLIGCVSHRTLKEVDQFLIWQSDESIFAMQPGGNPVNIATTIEPIIQEIFNDRKAYSSASVDKDRGLYLISISYNSGFNNVVLAFNYREWLLDGVERWYLWDIPLDCLSEGIVDTERRAVALFAKDAIVGDFRSGLDLGAGISWKWQSGLVNPYAIEKHQWNNVITFLFDVEPGITIKAGYYTGNTEFTRTRTTTTRQKFKVPVNARTEYIGVIVEGVDVRQDMSLNGFSFSGTAIGLR